MNSQREARFFLDIGGRNIYIFSAISVPHSHFARFAASGLPFKFIDSFLAEII